jgi:hypothetical protein
MGLGEMSQEKYFETILGHINEEREHPDLSPLSPTGLIDDAKVLNSRGILPPHSFTLPHSMLWCSLPSHRDLFSNDDICDLEFGDGDLDWIMEEEEQLDIEDNLKSKEHEGSLWNQACI